MPRQGRRRLGALGAALVLALAGCATGPDRQPPIGASVGADEMKDLLHRWEADWHAFAGLRAAVDLTVRRNGKTDRAAAVLLLSPTQLRLEVATPFGFPALVATVGPDRVTIFRPLERAAWTARPTPEAVGRWLGAPVPPEVLIGLLAGHVPPPLDPADVRLGTTDGPHLEFERGSTRQRVWVTPQGQPARLLLDAAEPLRVTFEWTVSRSLYSLRVEVPNPGAELSVRYISAESVTPSPQAFELTLPTDVRVERLD